MLVSPERPQNYVISHVQIHCGTSVVYAPLKYGSLALVPSETWFGIQNRKPSLYDSAPWHVHSMMRSKFISSVVSTRSDVGTSTSVPGCKHMGYNFSDVPNASIIVQGGDPHKMGSLPCSGRIVVGNGANVAIRGVNISRANDSAIEVGNNSKLCVHMLFVRMHTL